MSAPDTNIDKQTQRHWPSILGICVALGIGVLIGLFLAGFISADDAQVPAAEVSTEG